MNEAVEEPDVCYYCDSIEDECTCEKCEMCDENMDAGDCNCVECHVCDTKLIEDEAQYDEYNGAWHCMSCCVKCGNQGDTCDCCEFCELPSHSCECHSAFGYTEKPGWEKRGHIIRDVNNGDCFKKVWPELDLSIDPVQEAATFYLLEGISHGVPYLNGDGPFHATTKEVARFTELFGDEYIKDALGASRKGSIEQKLKSIALEAASVLNERTLEIVDSFWAYVHIAVSGESRHHQAIGGRVLLGPRDYAWTGWRQVYDTVGSEAIADLVELFHEFGDGSFGGKVWADAATILYNYERGKLGPDEMTNKRMFLDRIFTMVHNNGSLLDKVGWKCNQGIQLDAMEHLLDAHAADEPNWELLYTASNNTAQSLLDAWYFACERYLESNGQVKTFKRPQKASLTRMVCASCLSSKGEGHYLGCYTMGKKTGWSNGYVERMIWDLPVTHCVPIYDEKGNPKLPVFDEDDCYMTIGLPKIDKNEKIPEGYTLLNEWPKEMTNLWSSKEERSLPNEVTLPTVVPITKEGNLNGNYVFFEWNRGSTYSANGHTLSIQVSVYETEIVNNCHTGVIKTWSYFDLKGNHFTIPAGTTIKPVKLLEAFLAGKAYK